MTDQGFGERWRVAIMSAVAAALIAGAAIVAVQAAPPVVANLTQTASDGKPRTLTSGSASAVVLPPEGWVVSSQSDGEAALTLRSPDGVLTMAMVVSDAAPDAAFDALAKSTSAETASAGSNASAGGNASAGSNAAAAGESRAVAPGMAPAQHETLASGFALTHANAGDSALLAVVSVEGGAVSVVARVEPGIDAALYRASIAQVLEGISS